MIPSDPDLIGQIIHVRKTHQSASVITVLAGNTLWLESTYEPSFSLTIINIVHVCRRVFRIINYQGSPETITLSHRSVLYCVSKVRVILAY
jgi:hypothetical protein